MITHTENSLSNHPSKRAACIEWLNQWLADESGYNVATWPKIIKTTKDNRASSRLPSVSKPMN
jgi:hypothetical protein